MNFVVDELEEFFQLPSHKNRLRKILGKDVNDQDTMESKV
jgi:hypothetical protein